MGQRSEGTSRMVSSPPKTMSHVARGDSTPHGRVAPRPVSVASVEWAICGTSAGYRMATPRSRKAASLRGVGKSKTSVSGSAAPEAACRRWRSSTAPCESRPASMSGASASTRSPVVRCAMSRTSTRLGTCEAWQSACAAAGTEDGVVTGEWCHGKLRGRYTSGGSVRSADPTPTDRRSTACAIVPE